MDPNQHNKLQLLAVACAGDSVFVTCRSPSVIPGAENCLYRLISACMQCWHYPLEPTLFRRRHCDVATNLTSPRGNRVKRPPMLGDVDCTTVTARKSVVASNVRFSPTLCYIEEPGCWLLAAGCCCCCCCCCCCYCCCCCCCR